MSEIVSKVNVMSAAYEKLVAMPTPDLREELARALTITADSLMYLAAVWKELEQRGEDLSDLRTGLGVYVPLIAAVNGAAIDLGCDLACRRPQATACQDHAASGGSSAFARARGASPCHRSR